MDLLMFVDSKNLLAPLFTTFYGHWKGKGTAAGMRK